MNVKEAIERLRMCSERIVVLAEWIDWKYPNDDNPEVQNDLRTWSDDIRTVLDLIDKLPRTADGVPVVPGMKVWADIPYSRGREVFALRVGGDMMAVCQFMDSVYKQHPIHCYSTREAALAAKEANE